MKKFFAMTMCAVLMAACDKTESEGFSPLTEPKTDQTISKESESNELGIENDTVFTVNGVSFKMIRVEGGTFTMGSNDSSEPDAQPPHDVILSTFYIAETEVTQELYKAVMGTCPTNYAQANSPVGKITRIMANAFIEKLKALTDFPFNLPTEAQWEFAARGGNLSRNYLYSGSDNCSDVAVWYGDLPKSVASKKPNELGIYDMSGNMLELCYDWYGPYSSASRPNPTGALFGTARVTRGGSYLAGKSSCTVFTRTSLFEDKGWDDTGFRLAIR